MADIVNKKKRSEIMRAIKDKDSKIEKTLRKELSGLDLKYRKNVSYLNGKPDIAFTRKKIVIFLDSCFWHGCKNHSRMPQTNRLYWKEKIEKNKTRDLEIDKFYKKIGWEVLRFWEHSLKNNLPKIIKKVQTALKTRAD